ncbi:MAG: HYR domain-containing protein, partial [Saprospiraceae bacterium]
MKKVYEASTPGFSRVMSNVVSLFSSRTMSVLPRLATLLCLSVVGANVAYAQPCAGVNCDISFANVPPPPPGNPAPVTLCLNSDGIGYINSTQMAYYTNSSSGCCTIVKVWENALATNPLTAADPDFEVDCTDIGRFINVWVTRETNQPFPNTGRSAPLPFRILIADCTNPTITCPAPETLTCASDYVAALPPNPMTEAEYEALGGGADVDDNCNIDRVEYSDVFSNFSCTNRFTVTRTYIVYDQVGLTASCTQVITVSDNVKPDITVAPSDLVLNCPDIRFGPAAYAIQVGLLQVQIQAWLNNFGGGAVLDNCGGGFINGNAFGGLGILLCVAFDPVLGCTNSTPLFASTVWDQMPDACSPQPREVQVMFVVKDECDNQSFATAKVILEDNNDPGLNIGNPFLDPLPSLFGSYDCADLVPGPNIESIRPEVSDNCTPREDLLIEWVEDNPTTVDGCNGSPANPLAVDIIQRVYRITDCAGNSQTLVQNIRVKDDVDPDWTNNPNNLELLCDDPAMAAKITAWLASYGTDGEVDDYCNNVTVANNFAAVSVGFPNWCPPPAVGAELNTPYRAIFVTWRATDDCGNSATRSARLRLRDVQPPTGTAPFDITISCNTLPAPNTALITDETDNCSDVVAVAHLTTTVIWNGTGCADDPIIYRRNYSLTDCAGNSQVVTQYITVADEVDPVWTGTITPLNLNCTAGGINASIAAWLSTHPGASATDNCTAFTYSTDPVNADNVRDALGDCAPLAGSTVVTFIATDNCGNSATVTGTVTITDNTNPTASTPIASNYNCLDEVPAPNVNVVTDEADGCSPAGTVEVEYLGQSDNGGTGCPGNALELYRTYRVKDCSFVDIISTPNNYIDVVHTIIVVDNVDPNANCKPYTAYLGADGTVDVNATDFDDNSADNCDGALTYEFARDVLLDDLELIYGPYTVTKEFNCDDIVPNLESCAGNVNNQEVIGIRLRVFDACGNPSGFCTTALTLIDAIKPTIPCPADITIYTDADGGYDCMTSFEVVHPVPADNCDVVCYEMEVQKEYGGVWTTINPEWGTPSPNHRVDVLGVFSNTYNFEKGPLCIPGSIDDEYRIIYYVRDEHGNSLDVPCDYIIKIEDNEAPVFTFCPSAPIIEAQTTAGDCYQMKCWEPPTYYDNCQFPYSGEGSGQCPIPELVVTTNDPSVMVDLIGDDHCALFPVGQTEIYYTVTDICNNTATCTVTVIITDIEPPMAMCVAPFSVNLQPNGLLQLTFDDLDAGSTDNCGLCAKEIGRVYTTGGPILYGGSLYLTCDDVDNSPITLYLRVKDCGDPVANEDVCSVEVTVLDMQLPGIATCPADIIVCTDDDVCNAEVDYLTPTFNDGCNSQHDGNLIVGLASGSVFPIGTTLVAWDYTSVSGYNVVCQFNVTVEDCEAPTLICPPDVTLTCLEPLCCPEDLTGGTSTDNCGVTLVQSSDYDNGLSHCTYDGIRTIIRTYTTWDAAGNTSTCSREYVYTEDTEKPVLAETPADVSYECAADVLAPPVQSATDNCGTVNIDFSEVVDNNVCVNQTVIVRTWTATDLCGDTTQHVQTITVNDNDVPTFSNTPNDFTFDCSEDVPAVDAPHVDDNCDIFTVDFSEVVQNGGCEDRFRVFRTWVATDLCGNTATFTQTITIVDNVDPVISGVAPDFNGQCATMVPAIVPPTITDNCVQVTVDFSETVTPGGCEDRFILVRRWRATDACGNRTVSIQVITINDTTKPVLIGTANADDESVDCAADVPAVAAITATDNCGEPITVDFSEVEVPGACVNQYSIVRTWTAEDDCGNSTQHVQTITVEDDEAPTFSNKPGDYSSDCSEDVPAVVAPDVADNCDIFTVDFSETVAPGGCEDRFDVFRTWVATDLCGNTSTFTQTITIYDGEAPKFTNVPLSTSEDCAQDVPAVVHPDVSDNCSQVVVDFSETTAPGGCEDDFTVTRTWVATDACGNSVSVQQVIDIYDNIDPQLVGVPTPAFVTFDCAQDVPAVPVVTATDNCGEPLTVDFVEVNIPGTCHDRFRVRRTWTAEDDCGNSTQYTQIITVFDNEAPVLANTPDPLVFVECSEDVPLPPVFPPVSATDNCGRPVDLEFVELEVPGSCSNQYAIVRRWTAEDDCGNGTQFVQLIVVVDTEAPILHNLPAAVVDVDCASDVPAMPNPAVYATDNCGIPVDVEFSEVEIPGACQNQYSITRTWTAEDDCGNNTVFVQTINVYDDVLPVLAVTPLDLAFECYDEVPAAPINSATDNCGVAFIDFSESVEGGAPHDPNISCPNNVVITRRWVASDLCGNTTEHIQTITVSDIIRPVMLVTPIDLTFDCIDEVPAAPLGTLAADNCDVVNVDFSESTEGGTPQDPNWSCPNYVTLTRRWVATDLCGNTTEHIQTIIVHDETPPAWINFDPKDRTYECLDDVEGAPDQQTLAADNCEVVFVDFLETRDNDSCHNQVIIKRRWEATDLCGNKSTRWQYLTVYDDKAPVLRSTPSDRTYECVEDVETAPIGLAEDNCLVVFVDFAEFTNPGNCPSQVVINRRWLATDLCGNTDEHWQVITVNDDEAPVLSATPFDVNVDCSEDVPAAPVVTATDNCDDVLVEFSETTTPGGCLNQYVVTRHWQAADLCGNSVEHYQTITVNDDVKPTWTSALPQDVTVQCGEQVPTAAVTASDNCVAPLDIEMNETLLPGAGPNDAAKLTRIWIVTDACGNSISHKQIVTINDTQKPTLHNLPDASVSVQCSEQVPAVAPVTASDNCQGTIDFDFSEVEIPGTCPNQYVIKRTWSVTDFAGNSTSFVQTITVHDNVAPVLSSKPGDVSVECSEQVPALTVVTATDNCNAPVDVEISEIEIPGTCPNQYVIKRTWTAEDDCGNITVHTQTITVSDLLAPVLSSKPSDVAVECSEQVPALTAVTATDNCGKPVDVEISEIEVPGTCPNQYVIKRTWTAEDDCGNITVHTQTITVSDLLAPVLSSKPGDVAVECSEQVPALAVVTASDNCAKPVDVEISEIEIPGTCPNQYSIKRTWTAEDDCGNITVHTQTITVNDVIAPVLFNLPQAVVSVECSEEVPFPPFPPVFATDNCNAPVDLEFVELEVPGTCPNQYRVIRRWTAEDDCGNSTVFVQTIIVFDDERPVLHNLPQAEVNVQCSEQVPALPNPAVFATDNCNAPVDLELVEVEVPGTCPNQYSIIRRWTAEDDCGNSTMFVQRININDVIAPVLSSKPDNVSVECSEQVPALANVTATDNCNKPVDVEISEIEIPGTCPNQYQITRTWTAEDDCGNITVHTQTITVNDVIAPTLSSKPDNASVECSEQVPALAVVTATDNCNKPVDVEISEIEIPGTCPNQYQIKRTWTAEDDCGNITVHTQTITVNDVIAPVLFNLPMAEVNVQCSEQVPALPNPAVFATDNCNAPVDLELVEVEVPGTCPNQYSIIRRWTAEDDCGNSTFFVQRININDVIAPVLFNLPVAVVNVQCSEQVPALPSPAVFATDNCNQPVDLELVEVEVPGTCPNQ